MNFIEFYAFLVNFHKFLVPGSLGTWDPGGLGKLGTWNPRGLGSQDAWEPGILGTWGAWEPEDLGPWGGWGVETNLWHQPSPRGLARLTN